MIRKEGADYSTIADAAKIIGVSPKTFRDYINKKIVENPPTFVYGVRTLMHFPEDYMEKAKADIEEHRKKAVSKKGSD